MNFQNKLLVVKLSFSTHAYTCYKTCAKYCLVCRPSSFPQKRQLALLYTHRVTRRISFCFIYNENFSTKRLQHCFLTHTLVQVGKITCNRTIRIAMKRWSKRGQWTSSPQPWPRTRLFSYFSDKLRGWRFYNLSLSGADDLRTFSGTEESKKAFRCVLIFRKHATRRSSFICSCWDDWARAFVLFFLYA